MHSPVKKIYWLFPSFGNFATLSKIISVDYIYLCCAVLSCSVVSTVFDPMECSPPGYSVHGDSPGRNTGVGCHALLQGIFPTQGLNPCLLHCRRILYRLDNQQKVVEWMTEWMHEWRTVINRNKKIERELVWAFIYTFQDPHCLLDDYNPSHVSTQNCAWLSQWFF